MLLGAERFEEAATQFSTAIEIDSEYLNAQYNLGVTYVKWGAALQDIAIKNDDESTEYKEKFKMALNPLKSFLEIEPENSSLWEILGKVYAQLGMTEESKEAFDKADTYR